jgi:hypothetical protein
MDEEEMKEIIRWLDAKKHPFLVQGPKKTVIKLLKGIE